MSDVLQRILARKREEVAAARAAKSRTEGTFPPGGSSPFRIAPRIAAMIC